MKDVIEKTLKSLTKRCTWLTHKKHLVEETREDKGSGKVIITQYYECPLCGHKWTECITIDPNYQIDFHEI